MREGHGDYLYPRFRLELRILASILYDRSKTIILYVLTCDCNNVYFRHGYMHTNLINHRVSTNRSYKDKYASFIKRLPRQLT